MLQFYNEECGGWTGTHPDVGTPHVTGRGNGQIPEVGTIVALHIGKHTHLFNLFIIRR